MNAGKYEDAIPAFKALADYSDAAQKITECETAILERAYQSALALMNNGKYEDAIPAFETLAGYSDAAQKVVECETAILERTYQKADAFRQDGQYRRAVALFTQLGCYSDSAERAKEAKNAQTYKIAEDFAASENTAKPPKYSIGWATTPTAPGAPSNAKPPFWKATIRRLSR